MAKKARASRFQVSNEPMMSHNTKDNSQPAVSTGKPFNIRNVEMDIYMDKSTTEIATKYGKTEYEVVQLIEKAYSGKPAKIRELKKRLEKSDDEAKRRAVKAFNDAEKERAVRVAEIPAPFVEAAPEKTEIQLQREKVQEAEAMLCEAKKVVSFIDKQYQQALQKQKEAAKALHDAQKQKENADDEVRKCESRKASAIKERDACQKEYEEQNGMLQELCSKPKLMHSSALKKERKRIEGMVYVSQWDYDRMDDALKGLVNPVDTTGVNIRKYPVDFIWYPDRMGMDAYRSAVECALAFIKLREANEDLEFICCDDVVGQLVKMQEVWE